jgi:hypothetical protein
MVMVLSGQVWASAGAVNAAESTVKGPAQRHIFSAVRRMIFVDLTEVAGWVGLGMVMSLQWM